VHAEYDCPLASVARRPSMGARRMAPRHSEDSRGSGSGSGSGGTGGRRAFAAEPELDLPGYHDFVLVARSDASEVYRARQDGLDRFVAVKVLLLDEAEAVARFRRELEITVRLGRQHPHIVTVIDTGTTSTGRPCIVMEYYDLGSVHDRLKAHGPLPPDEVIAVGTVVADALAFAHSHGVLHRDVKPQNILMLPTSYVVADFGIARHIGAAHTASVEWFSYRHAAPQVLDGDAPAVQDDIWSVGSTLFTLLEGVSPFASDDPAEDTALPYMRRVRAGARRAMTVPNTPPGLVAVIERCLRQDRAERFPSAAELREAFATLSVQARTAWAPRGTSGALPGPDDGGPATIALPPSRPSAPATAAPTAPPVAPPGAGLAPGMAPPGMAPPGMAPPGVARPGMAPPGVARPGMAPPGVARPGMAPPVGLADPTTARGAAAEMSPSDLAYLVASAVAAGGFAPGGDTTRRPGKRAEKQPAAIQQPPPPAAAQAVPVAAPSYFGGDFGLAGERQPEEADRAGGRMAALVIFALVGVLLIGSLIFAGTWIYRHQRPAASAPRPSTAPPPTRGGALPFPETSVPAQTASASASPDPALAPVITRLDVADSTVSLRWRDTTNGQAQYFVIVHDTGDGSQTVQPLLGQGTTQTTLPGLAPPYCFRVFAIVTVTQFGVSKQKCSGSPG
jgi:eukaryotic-like serine/threonine-protein kinase